MPVVAPMCFLMLTSEFTVLEDEYTLPELTQNQMIHLIS